MAPNNLLRFVTFSLVLTVSLALFPISAYADPAGNNNNNPSTFTSLASFTQSVTDGENAITGVFVNYLFAFPVTQQPAKNFNFISGNDNVVTQFKLAAEYENIGLLAHDYLAGKYFFKLTNGQSVYLVYGTGRVEAFLVTQVYQYQALDPNNPSSNLKDLETGKVYTAQQVFRLMYMGEHHIAFQTCIEKNGNLSWGRLFIIAEPVQPR